jgi:cytochrome c-type biogenesis protein
MVDVSVGIAFVAGLLSFLNPCVLPLVPGFLGYLAGVVPGDTGAGRWKIFSHSLFFVLGFSVVFALIGVLLSTALQGISFSIKIWLGRLSGLLIILFGCQLAGILKIRSFETEKKIRVKDVGVEDKKNLLVVYGTTFLFGAAFGLSWTPCVGLILGSVLALAASHPARSLLLLVSYALGMGVPFLVVGFFTGAALQAVQKMGRFLSGINKAAGVFLIGLGLFVFVSYARTYPFGMTHVPAGSHKTNSGSSVIELAPPDEFINTAPFALKDWLGRKVIVLDFWRFGCPNCLESVPYVEAWYQKYKDQGLVVVGVHSPELPGERDPKLVRAAVRMLGITYPVVTDNEYQNLNRFNVIYWPTIILIDVQGRVVARHIGAGGYKKIEDEIAGLVKKEGHGP